jgi:hypothetical protein
MLIDASSIPPAVINMAYHNDTLFHLKRLVRSIHIYVYTLFLSIYKYHGDNHPVCFKTIDFSLSGWLENQKISIVTSIPKHAVDLLTEQLGFAGYLSANNRLQSNDIRVKLPELSQPFTIV